MKQLTEEKVRAKYAPKFLELVKSLSADLAKDDMTPGEFEITLVYPEKHGYELEVTFSYEMQKASEENELPLTFYYEPGADPEVGS